MAIPIHQRTYRFKVRLARDGTEVVSKAVTFPDGMAANSDGGGEDNLEVVADQHQDSMEVTAEPSPAPAASSGPGGAAAASGSQGQGAAAPAPEQDHVEVVAETHEQDSVEVVTA